MTVIKGTGFYHVEAARTNRQMTFQITAPEGQSSVFLFLKGQTTAFPPWIHAVAAPTVNQLIAQYRADYVIRYISIYAIPVEVQITSVNVGMSETNNALVVSYETYVSNILPSTADITDTLGMADRAAKTKPGIQTLLNDCVANASLDGGTTLLFAANPNLSDGTPTTAAAVGTGAGTLTATLLTTNPYV